MDVSSVGSSPQTSVSDLTQLLKEVNQMQMEMVKKMLQVQTAQTVGAQKVETAEEVQGAVDYYA